MNDNFYYFQTAVRESAQNARILEEKIDQLIDIIDSKNNTINNLVGAIRIHQAETFSAQIKEDNQKSSEANQKLWKLLHSNEVG